MNINVLCFVLAFGSAENAYIGNFFWLQNGILLVLFEAKGGLSDAKQRDW